VLQEKVLKPSEKKRKKMINKIPRWVIETLFWYVCLIVVAVIGGLHYVNAIIFASLFCCFGWGLMIVYPFFDSLFFFLWKRETSDYITMRYFFITLLGSIMIVGSVIIFKALYVNG
jgi:hypothetical protein